MTDLSFYRGKRVCVTGATGLIGFYVNGLLLDAGALVVPIGHRRKPKGIWWEPRILDLLVPEHALEAVQRVEIVINCAGITGGVGLPGKDPVGYVGPATAMAINVLHACHVAKVERMGFLSSTTVYPPLSHAAKEGDEDDTYLGPSGDGKWRPLALYPLYRGIGESKRFLEKLCRYYHETTGIGVGIVRPSGAYGRYDNFDESTSHVVPGMINRALNLKAGEDFVVWGDGQDVRDFIHAEDVARGLLLAVAHRPDCTPINIASGKPVSTAQLADAVLTAAGKPNAVYFDETKPTALRSRTVDISRARELLGFEPRISLDDGIRDTVEWRRAQL